MLGINPAPNPCILWPPGFPPLNTGEASGSTAIAFMAEFFFLRFLATPVIVPQFLLLQSLHLNLEYQ